MVEKVAVAMPGWQLSRRIPTQKSCWRWVRERLVAGLMARVFSWTVHRSLMPIVTLTFREWRGSFVLVRPINPLFPVSLALEHGIAVSTELTSQTD